MRLWIVHTEMLSDLVCSTVLRNLTLEEWHQFIGGGDAIRAHLSQPPSGGWSTSLKVRGCPHNDCLNPIDLVVVSVSVCELTSVRFRFADLLEQTLSNPSPSGSEAYLSDHMASIRDVLAQTLGIQEGQYRLLPVTIEPGAEERLPVRIGMLSSVDLADARRGERNFNRLVAAPQGPLPTR